MRISPLREGEARRGDDLAHRLITLLNQSPCPVKGHSVDDAGFNHAIRRTEKKLGERALLLDSVSEIFVDEKIHRARGQWLVEMALATQQHVNDIMAARRDRRRAVISQLNTPPARVRDLYPQRAIHRLVQRNRFSLDESFAFLGAPEPQLTDDQVLAVLDTMLYFLDVYPKTYDLILAADDGRLPADQQQWSSFWLVKKGAAVLVETFRTMEGGRKIPVELEIEDHWIAERFYALFEDLWEHLPALRDREREVKPFLRQQRAIVQKRIRRRRDTERARQRRSAQRIADTSRAE
jgi:hypothetical protein